MMFIRKTKKYLLSKWGSIRYRHVICLQNNKEILEFYSPIYDWLTENIELKNVWLEGEVIRIIEKTRIVVVYYGTSTYKFRFKKKKDAVAFKLVWG